MRSRIETRLKSGIRNVLLASSIVLLAACQQEQAARPDAQASAMEWARAALERNPQLELVATDPDTQMFTVRDRRTGDVRVVQLNELAAAPITQLSQQQPAAAPRADEAAVPAAQEGVTPEEKTGPQLAQAPQTASESPQPETTTASEQPQTPTSSDPAASYTIERSDGQVRVTGPGVSIVSSGGVSQGHEGTSHGNAVEPIICEGKRMVHLDGRQMFVDGDAITVRGGCELYVTNSYITATGTGVVVQDGTVHVSNSTIDGQDGSFDVGDEAKLFARSSTFRGIPRRSEKAVVQDQGGNRWR